MRPAGFWKHVDDRKSGESFLHFVLGDGFLKEHLPSWKSGHHVTLFDHGMLGQRLIDDVAVERNDAFADSEICFLNLAFFKL